MILSDLLTRPVIDAHGHSLGRVLDVRFVIDGAPGQLLAEARLAGLIISPRAATSFLGYERTDEKSPWLIASYLRWRHRGSFFVRWEDVDRLTSTRIVLARSYRKRSAALPD
ncbi:MAG: PRC-barrel domain containing protein [Subtercola sp.]|nr:PRC-barrel domain containing protein [Subtercola sp.]